MRGQCSEESCLYIIGGTCHPLRLPTIQRGDDARMTMMSSILFQQSSTLTASYPTALSQPFNKVKFTYHRESTLGLLFLVNSTLYLPVKSGSMKIVHGNVQVCHCVSGQRVLIHPCITKNKHCLYKYICRVTLRGCAKLLRVFCRYLSFVDHVLFIVALPWHSIQACKWWFVVEYSPVPYHLSVHNGYMDRETLLFQ